MNSTEYKMGELVTLSQGQVINAKTNYLVVNEGLPLLRIGDMINERQEIFIDEERVPKKNIAKKKDIIFTRTGQVGLVFKNQYGVVHNNCFKVIPDEDVLNTDFLFWFLRSPKTYKWVQQLAGGAAQPDLPHGAFNSLIISLPDIPTQKKIASILSTYDDLIENNNQRILLLEEMAEEIYKEWFVRLRFPGYQDSKFFDKYGNEVSYNTNGALPENWEKIKLGAIIDVKRGSSPRPISDQRYFDEGTIPWLKIADATASKIFIYKTKEYVNEYGASFSRHLSKGSLVVAASGTLGFPMILGVEACIHDGWLYFIGIDDIMKEYFYFSFGGLKQYFENQSYGAAIQNINTEIVSKSPFVNPDKDILLEFKKVVSPLFKQLEVLQLKNQALQETRDLLLPRLISGKLSVEDINLENTTNMADEPESEYKS